MIYAEPLRHGVQQGGLALLIDRKIVGEETGDEGDEEENECFERRLVSRFALPYLTGGSLDKLYIL